MRRCDLIYRIDAPETGHSLMVFDALPEDTGLQLGPQTWVMLSEVEYRNLEVDASLGAAIRERADEIRRSEQTEADSTR